MRLAEQAHDGLWRLVGDRQRLDTQLLLDLQRLELGAFLRQIRVDQVTDRAFDHVVELAGTQQLVQYSQVEQSIQQTGVLKDILARLSGDDLARAGQLIGRTAEFSSSVAGLSATQPAEWRWTLPSRPASVEAEILDSGGRVVARPSVSTDASASFIWDGTLAAGGKAPEGAYVLRLIARDSAGAAMTTAKLTSVGKVNEVVAREGELWVGLGGVALPLDKLIRIAA